MLLTEHFFPSRCCRDSKVRLDSKLKWTPGILNTLIFVRTAAFAVECCWPASASCHVKITSAVPGSDVYGLTLFVVLGVSGDSTPILDRATFPENESRLTSHGRLLCWLPNCWRCGHAPEAVGVHSDCLSVFQEVCKAEDALDRLWVAAARSPWRGAPNLHLGCATNLAVELVYERSRVYGIPCLRLLPPELIEMIRDYSESATFWRHISALSFGIELSTTPAQTASPSLATSIPLCDILAWTRGQEPTLVQPPDRSPVIRLTIDYRGIRQVERLPRKSQYQQFRSDNMAFAIEDEDQLKDIIVQFKVRLLS